VPFETVDEKYSCNDVSTILLTDEKIFTVITLKKNKESPTVRNCSNQEERRHDKTIARTINVQAVTDGINFLADNFARYRLIFINSFKADSAVNF